MNEYLSGRRDIKSVYLTVVPDESEDDNYQVECVIDCVRGGRKVYLSDLSGGSESRVHRALSELLQHALISVS